MDHGTSFDAKEQVRQATDIVELASGYLQLRRQGRMFVATCPWHDDTRPSLQINPERQTFKCWVCDIGGDVFNFLMRLERLEFREALEQLAERAGIELTPTSRPTAPPGSPADKTTQFASLAWTVEQFCQCLAQAPAAQMAREYLRTRGITAGSITKFQIGFSPNEWEWLTRKTTNGKFSPEVLERVGVLGRRNNSEGYYDRFKGRVIFPISDVRNRPIAFGGRILPEFADERAAKYVNSPETPLYNKSHQLYALNLAREAIAQAGEVIVMEGYTDVIMAHQHGVENAVAVCGTALGEGHLRLLRRFTDRVVLVLDGDEAGQRRTNEVLELFIQHQMDLRILTLPEGLDPCDFLAQQGHEAFRSLLDQSLDALEHKFRQVTSRVGNNASTHEATQAIEELLAVLAKAAVPSGAEASAAMLRQQQMLGRIAHRFGLREDDLRERLKSLRRSETSLYSPAAPLQNESGHPRTMQAVLSAWEKEIFELVLSNPDRVVPIIESIPQSAMQSELAVRLYGRLLEMQSRAMPVTFEGLMATLDDESDQKQLIDLDESAQLKQESDGEQRLQDVIARYHQHQEKNAQREQLASLREGAIDDSHKEELLNDFFQNLKRRQAGSLSTDG